MKEVKRLTEELKNSRLQQNYHKTRADKLEELMKNKAKYFEGELLKMRFDGKDKEK